MGHSCAYLFLNLQALESMEFHCRYLTFFSWRTAFFQKYYQWSLNNLIQRMGNCFHLCFYKWTHIDHKVCYNYNLLRWTSNSNQSNHNLLLCNSHTVIYKLLQPFVDHSYYLNIGMYRQPRSSKLRIRRYKIHLWKYRIEIFIGEFFIQCDQ